MEPDNYITKYFAGNDLKDDKVRSDFNLI